MAIQSPCVDICKLDGNTGFCIGCLRTRDEIRAWKTLSDDLRLDVINQRPHREVTLKAEMQAKQETQATPAS